MVSHFTDDALVQDVGEIHQGVEALRGWARGVVDRYQPSFEVLTVSSSGNDVTVTTLVSGSFDGSPANITQLFGLTESGQIRAMRVP
jgi:hypothetical protein